MREVNRFIEETKLKFGDYILFQEYNIIKTDEEVYNVSRPILAIYLGCFACDQTLGFNYVKWNNDNHTVYVSNEYGTFPTCKEVDKIYSHIEWDNFIDILGHWTNKPNWKEIIASYRKQNLNLIENILE